MAFSKTAGADRGGRRSKRGLVEQSHRVGRHFNLTARFCCKFAADAATPDRRRNRLLRLAAAEGTLLRYLSTGPAALHTRSRQPTRSRSLPSAPAKLDAHRVHPDGDEKVSTTPVERANEGAGHPGRLRIGDAAPVRVTLHRPSARARSLTTKMHCSDSANITPFQGILASRNCQCSPARASAKRPRSGISI
jgi:hypothetical protein